MMGKRLNVSFEWIAGDRIRVLNGFDFMGEHVPAGFEFDGQSWFIGEQRALPPSALHDLQYRHNGRVPGSANEYTRAQADALFRRGLIECGVTRTQAWIRWAGLRAFGWKAWNSHKKSKNEKSNLTQPSTAVK